MRKIKYNLPKKIILGKLDEYTWSGVIYLKKKINKRNNILGSKTCLDAIWHLAQYNLYGILKIVSENGKITRLHSVMHHVYDKDVAKV